MHHCLQLVRSLSPKYNGSSIYYKTWMNYSSKCSNASYFLEPFLQVKPTCLMRYPHQVSHSQMWGWRLDHDEHNIKVPSPKYPYSGCNSSSSCIFLFTRTYDYENINHIVICKRFQYICVCTFDNLRGDYKPIISEFLETLGLNLPDYYLYTQMLVPWWMFLPDD